MWNQDLYKNPSEPEQLKVKRTSEKTTSKGKWLPQTSQMFYIIRLFANNKIHLFISNTKSKGNKYSKLHSFLILLQFSVIYALEIILVVFLWWKCYICAPAHLCPTLRLSNVILVAWHQPQWEDLYHRKC